MELSDRRRCKAELQDFEKELEDLTAHLKLQSQQDEKYLRVVVREIIEKTKAHADSMLRAIKENSESTRTQVAEVQLRVKDHLRSLENIGQPRGDQNVARVLQEFAKERHAIANLPLKVTALDSSAVLAAIEGFMPRYESCIQAEAGTILEPTIEAGMEFKGYVGSRIDENSEFWLQPQWSAEVGRRLLNCSLLCRGRWLARGQAASFASCPSEAKVGLVCWAVIDRQFHRSVIENVKTEGARTIIIVRSLDIGKAATLKCDDIFPLSERDHEVPYQAIKCRLSSNVYTKLTNDARWAFADVVNNKLLDCKVHSRVLDVECPATWEVTLKDPECDTTVNSLIAEKASCHADQQKKTRSNVDIRLLNPETALASGIEKVVTLCRSRGPTEVVSAQSPDDASAVSQPLSAVEEPKETCQAVHVSANPQSVAVVEHCGSAASGSIAQSTISIQPPAAQQQVLVAQKTDDSHLLVDIALTNKGNVDSPVAMACRMTRMTTGPLAFTEPEVGLQGASTASATAHTSLLPSPENPGYPGECHCGHPMLPFVVGAGCGDAEPVSAHDQLLLVQQVSGDSDGDGLLIVGQQPAADL